MITKDWRTSPREHDVIVERDVVVPATDDVNLVGDLFRPDTDDPVPTLIGAHPYNTYYQTAPIKPKSIGPQLAWVESGDPNFYARRGYAHLVLNLRGTGKSGGEFRNLDQREAQDVADAMGWLADRPWSDGSFGMLGVSYFAMIQQQVAMLNPDPLKAIFAPWGMTDPYRDMYYHGGVLADGFAEEWVAHLDNPRLYSWSRDHLSEDELAEAIGAALGDPEIYAKKGLADALENPHGQLHALLVDVILNHLDGDYWAERRVDYSDTSIPAYLGAGWGHYAIHLGAAFRSFNHWEGPKKLLIGPDIYLDRPVYQLGYESLRWFDHWLKGEKNGIMDEPPVKVFAMGTGEWREAEEWPLPETRWIPFYLHEDGLLFEREHWPNEGYTTFEDSPYRHERLDFRSPAMVEATEMMGPSRLTLYASTTDTEVLFFVKLFKEDAEGEETALTRGWLRGSQRKVDDARSEPWKVYHPHDERERLEPDEIYEFDINLRETGVRLFPGERLGLRIQCADVGRGWGDDEDVPPKEALATGHVYRQTVQRITVYHNADHPSRLLIPVTEGNVLETYYSGGSRTPQYGELPYREVLREKDIPQEPTEWE